jgi:predicted acetyltransferase
MRYATPEDFSAIADLDGASFGFVYSERDLADAQLELTDARILVAEAGGRIVGASAELPFRMTMPGGASVRAAGITWVSVEISHRRKGILRGLVERQLRDQRDAGWAAAILTASEGAIYGRFGFGVAEQTVTTVVERHRAALRHPVAEPGVERLPAEAIRDRLPPIYERWRQQQPGGLDRSDAQWRFHLLDREFQRGGASPLFHLVHPQGYVSYRIAEDWNGGLPQHTCHIVDYAPVSAEAHAALWQVLLANTLVGRIESIRVPPDDPLPYLLTNPRHARVIAARDGLWVRPLDVAALLSARTYAVDVDVVIEVVDPLLGGGRYHLAGGPSGATCERTDTTADATLPVDTVGAIANGGIRLATLARAGRASGEPSVLTRLDRAFLADRAPSHGTHF